MSVVEEIELLNQHEEVKIRGNLSIEDLVRRQIDRCNITISSADSEVFNANVRALMKHLPAKKLKYVLSRADEYNSTVTRHSYMNSCGINSGTPTNPVVQVAGHPEWDFMFDIPQDFRDRFADRIAILSPTEYEETITDYETLYEIVLQTYQDLELTWNVEHKLLEMGKVRKTAIPEWLIKESVQAVVEVIINARKQDKLFNHLSYNEIVEVMREKTPSVRMV